MYVQKVVGWYVQIYFKFITQKAHYKWEMIHGMIKKCKKLVLNKLATIKWLMDEWNVSNIFWYIYKVLNFARISYIVFK